MERDERLFETLKSMTKYETRSFEELAKEIWISQPTLRAFWNGKYSEKTFKLVDTWFKSHVNYLSNVYTKYWDIEHDKE